MIAKDLMKRIAAEKGPLFVEISNFNDTHWVKVVKRDLIDMVRQFNPDQETGYELDSRGFFGKDYSV
jgi:hypothetical protein